MQLFSADPTIFKKKSKFFLPPKSPLLLIIPLDHQFSVQQVFGSVELRQFYSLKLSHLWSFQALQDEKYLIWYKMQYYTVLYSLYSGQKHPKLNLK